MVGKSKSYLGAIKALDGHDISRDAAETLGDALGEWLGQQGDAANNPHLVHAMSEGKAALKAPRERLRKVLKNLNSALGGLGD